MSFTWCKIFFVLIICFFIFMTLDYIWWQEVYRTQSDNSGGQRSLQRHKSSRQIRYKVSLTKLLCISIVLTHIMSKESLRIKGNLFCFIKKCDISSCLIDYVMNTLYYLAGTGNILFSVWNIVKLVWLF